MKIVGMLLVGYYGLLYVFFLGHLFVHSGIWHWAYDAHVNGHHKDGDYTYTTHLKVNLIDAIIALPLLVLLRISLPALFFHLVLAELIVLSAISTLVHISFHKKGHWPNRIPGRIGRWYRKAKRLHFLHHPNMAHNLSLLSAWPDKLHGTYLGRREDSL